MMAKLIFVIFTTFSLIAGIVCDNVTSTTTKTTESTTPALSLTSQSTPSITSEATTSNPSTSVAPSLENSTKLAQYPSNRTRALNTTSYVCSCDLTVNTELELKCVRIAKKSSHDLCSCIFSSPHSFIHFSSSNSSIAMLIAAVILTAMMGSLRHLIAQLA